LFDAFSSLEDALIVDPASGTGASSTPCRTRPARSSPRAGQLFEALLPSLRPIIALVRLT
jgi:hypothetical protein